MSQSFKPRQSEKAAGSLDGVDQAEDVVEDLRVVGILLEANEFDIDHIEALVRLREEFAEQVIHEKIFRRQAGGLGRLEACAVCWERV